LCRNVPAKALAEDAKLALMDKKGAEKKYGEFRAKVLGDPAKGTRLVHAMLLPRKGAAAKLNELEKERRAAGDAGCDRRAAGRGVGGDDRRPALLER